MRLRILLLFLVFLIVNASCVGVTPVQDASDPSDDWAYDSILFEIAPVATDTLPSQDALDWFRDRLHDYRFCDKASISFVVMSEDDRPGPALWDLSSLVYYTARRRASHSDMADRKLVIFVPYITGPYLGFDGLKVLGGIQYQSTAFAIFRDGVGDREPAVLLHEFGHLLGIADDAPHGNVDPDHTSHCADDRCVMYWSTPTRYSRFDDHCLAYIQDWLRLRKAKLY